MYPSHSRPISQNTVLSSLMREAKAQRTEYCSHCGADVSSSAEKSRHSSHCAGEGKNGFAEQSRSRTESDGDAKASYSDPVSFLVIFCCRADAVRNDIARSLAKP